MHSILLVLSGNSGTTYMYFKTRHILHAIHQMEQTSASRSQYAAVEKKVKRTESHDQRNLCQGTL